MGGKINKNENTHIHQLKYLAAYMHSKIKEGKKHKGPRLRRRTNNLGPAPSCHHLHGHPVIYICRCTVTKDRLLVCGLNREAREKQSTRFQ